MRADNSANLTFDIALNSSENLAVGLALVMVKYLVNGTSKDVILVYTYLPIKTDLDIDEYFREIFNTSILKIYMTGLKTNSCFIESSISCGCNPWLYVLQSTSAQTYANGPWLVQSRYRSSRCLK